MVMEVGRVCVKLAGHEAGKRCVIVEIIDGTYVVVSGPGVKRRRCNIAHLEPLEKKLDIDKGASDEDAARALEAAGLVEIKKPPARPPKPKVEKPPEEKPPKPEEEKKPPEKAPPKRIPEKKPAKVKKKAKAGG